MDRKHLHALAIAALLVAPGVAAAQTPDSAGPAGTHDGPPPAGGRRAGGPASWVLSQRDELALNADQVAKLQLLEDKYEQQNRPLMDRLRQAWSDSTSRPNFRDKSPEERRQARDQYLAQHPDVADAMKRIRANQESARKEALAVLTPAQQDQLRQRMARWRERGDSAGRGGWRGASDS